ncbi:hypothetical protein [Thiocystis violacea]|uniref:hypothetical protein n=1 Tax=Thiocystis violacea TaxID=13725 RepID=UPI0019077B01|nr:hypothetical protein [Thiocystis violacea]MBK1719736.1 hypothetical protein [Thiocystis violacea]
MRPLIKSLVWTAGLGLVAILLLGLLLVLDSRPLVVEDPQPTRAERLWLRNWIATNRPRVARDEPANQLELSEREVSLLVNELLDRTGQGRARVRLGEARASLALSLKLPLDHLDGYLNLQLELTQAESLPRVESARVAGLPIPGLLVQTLAERALVAIDRSQLIHQVEFAPDRLRVGYEWRPDMMERIGSGFVADLDLPEVLRYQESLDRFAATRPKREPLLLAETLSHLLAQADASGADPVASNRALILALAAYVNGRSIRDPAADGVRSSVRYRPVLLRGRRDLGQHFMTSAAIAIQGNDTLSNLLGWYKEMADSNGGSGFSFPDMTANRAGIRFAQLATESPARAQGLQGFARRGLSEDDFMPPIDGLPEGMSQQRFNERFDEARRQDYQRLIASIDRRIESRPLFRQPPG